MRKRFFKNENGSITLFILLAILFFLIVLSSLYFNSSNKMQAQLSETDKIKKEYEKDINNVDQIYSDTLNDTSEKNKTLEEAKSDDMLKKDEDSKITISDKEITIPAGFKVADDSGTTIDEGIVIEDSKHNQFVWVPVSKENFSTEFIRREGYGNGSLQSFLSNSSEANATGINKKVTETETTQKEAIDMYASVNRNEGFYIGRYEAGKDANEKVVVQKNAAVYNNIPWSSTKSMQESTTETTGGAVELSRNFSKENNYKTVQSTLIYGVQWDAVMKWMKNINNPNVEGKTYIQDSTGMGWYNDNYSSGNSDHKTGIDIGELNNGSNQVNKIYDLAGNVREWTIESYGTTYRINRGGNYHVTSLTDPVSSRCNYIPSRSSLYLGFRLTLFLKS